MRKLYSFFLFLLIVEFAHSQNTVTGSFPGLANQHIKLVGFEGFTNYVIDSVMASPCFQSLVRKKRLGHGLPCGE